MAVETLTYSGQLTIVTCWCGMRHAVPMELRNYQLRRFHDGESIKVYCPLGHVYYPAGESRAAQLERELQRERQKLDQAEADAREQRESRERTERKLTATRGVVTRTKRRIANGTCPCCNRHFKDLHAHMDNKHPDYVTSD